jgi:hypothetical protein
MITRSIPKKKKNILRFLIRAESNYEIVIPSRCAVDCLGNGTEEVREEDMP